MVDSLHALGLYHKIIAAGGLDCPTISLKTLLSHGERQLFNLARLSITSSLIVVMDEATSSINDETERLARRFIRERFARKTIIGVVHRLGGLVEEDWDRYVLMDGGRVAETGEMKESGKGEKFVEFITGGSGS
jgi:ABC-type multidrug transport system fused ATPase/permease subunit